MIAPTSADVDPLANRALGTWVPNDPSEFRVPANSQPYFKLHGSSNWYASSTDNLLVVGGNKQSTIDRYPILKFNFEQFHENLNRPKTRLMIIGYGFGDDHINQMIVNAADISELGIFLIDPNGIDVIDDNRSAAIYSPGAMASALWPRIIGASRRPLSSTFNTDVVEHNKVMRFFDS